MKQQTFISWRTLNSDQKPLAQLGQMAGSRGSQILWYGDAPMLEMPQHHQIGTLRLVGRLQGRTCWIEEAAILAALGEIPKPSAEILCWIYHRISPALDFLHRSGIGHGNLSHFSIGISETGDPILIGVTGTSTPERDRAEFMHMWNSVSEKPISLTAEPLHRLLPYQPDHAGALLAFAQLHHPKASHTLRELQIEPLHHIHIPQLDEFDRDSSASESTMNRMESTLNHENTSEPMLNTYEMAGIPGKERNALSRLSDWLHRDCESIEFNEGETKALNSNAKLPPLVAPNGVLIKCWPKLNHDDDWEQTATLMVTKSKTQSSHLDEKIPKEKEPVPPPVKKPKANKPEPFYYVVGTGLTLGSIIIGYLLSTGFAGCT